MIGRLRSLPLTFVGAVVLGLADSYLIGYVPTATPTSRRFRFVVPVVLLFGVLLMLPNPQLRTRAVRALHARTCHSGLAGRAAHGGAVVATAVVLSNLLSEADALRTAKIFGVALIALSLIPLVGFAGQVSLCQMSFAGIGALVMAHHGPNGEPIALVYAASVCALVGALVALPAHSPHGPLSRSGHGAFAVCLDRWLFNLPAFDVGPVDDRALRAGQHSTVSPSTSRNRLGSLDEPAGGAVRRLRVDVPPGDVASDAAASGRRCWR